MLGYLSADISVPRSKQFFERVDEENWGIFSHMMHLDQSCASKKICWVIKLNMQLLMCGSLSDQY